MHFFLQLCIYAYYIKLMLSFWGVQVEQLPKPADSADFARELCHPIHLGRLHLDHTPEFGHRHVGEGQPPLTEILHPRAVEARGPDKQVSQSKEIRHEKSGKEAMNEKPYPDHICWN